MRSSFFRAAILEIVPALFILLFVYTGISKLLEHYRFRVVLVKSPLIGNMAGFLSVSLPIIELITSLLLFFPSTRKAGLWASLMLMCLFTGYIGYMIIFTPHLPCSCGGVFRRMSWSQHLVFNIVFTLLALTAIYITKKNKVFIAINRNSRTPV